MSSIFTWTDLYQELADKVLTFRNDRTAFVQLVEKSYKDANLEYKLYWEGHYFADLDPFTFFGTFNKGIADKNRIELLRQYKNNFGLSKDVPSEFTGIPVLNNMKAWFMADQQGEQMETYWDLFETAIKYADGDKNLGSKLEDLFDKAVTYEGTRWNITMGLFWIRPFSFINLDGNNRDKLKADGLFDGEFPTGTEYLKLCNDLLSQMDTDSFPYSNFPEFSSQSWVASSPEKVSNAAFLKWFGPLIKALRDLGGSASPQDARQKIVENEKLSEDDISQTRGKSNVNKFENEVAWARNYLVKGGYIDKSVKGVWSLTDAGKTVDMTTELASSIFLKGVKGNKKSKSSGSDDVLMDKDINTVAYWIYSPGNNADKWEEFYKEGIMAIGWNEIGDLSSYDSKEAMKQAMKAKIDPTRPYTMAAHATWQFANEMKPGDVVFAKKGMYLIVGRGVVESDYIYDANRDEYVNIRKVRWTHKGEWQHPGQAVMKTLTNITQYTDYVEKLNSLFDTGEIDDVEKEEIEYPVYDEEKFLSEVYMDKQQYDTLTGLIRNKKNVILQGAPGVGKTFAAKRLAYSMMGVMDKERVMMVQFHQSYSYEDFIMGFRPTETGFTLKKGAFYDFCKTAEIDSENDYFFIIDEINRGNLSKIFGELFMLIESDKRGVELKLLYADEKFSVPENVYIIGMMNTADRSLALMDYALRRRFAFFDMKPGFDTDGFREYKEGLNSSKFNSLITCVERLNEVIKNDDSLGEGFCIGHSYFCNLKDTSDQTLAGIVDYELVPLLKEYWFDEPGKAKDWTNSLRSSIK
jgi:5-methylcytosine-specific restriction protein B